MLDIDLVTQTLATTTHTLDLGDLAFKTQPFKTGLFWFVCISLTRMVPGTRLDSCCLRCCYVCAAAAAAADDDDDDDEDGDGYNDNNGDDAASPPSRQNNLAILFTSDLSAARTSHPPACQNTRAKSPRSCTFLQVSTPLALRMLCGVQRAFAALSHFVFLKRLVTSPLGGHQG
jgi:hypothetical protein